MLTTINGIPAHVLLIHAIVVLAPLGALFTILSAVWPAARRKLGFISPLTCLVVLVLTPVTTNAGEWLEDKLTKGQDGSPFAEKIEKHADLGDTFLYLAIALFVFSAAVWWIGRRNDAATPADAAVPASGGGTATATRATTTALPTALTYAVAAVAVVVSVITVVQLVRIGDSGAQAVWGGSGS
ncbi:DUF2231 domain-containing protein [Jatrophihabitans fulvus]